MSDTRRLVFHIGLEKTGTSSVQACLHHNEAVLRRHSILYPKRNAAYGWENHKPLVGCYAIDEVGDRWLPIDPSRRAAAVASLIDEIEGAPERTAVISAEHFSSRFRAEQIEQLRADFARFDCRIVIVIRDHLSRLCSAYESYVTNGGALPLNEFADGMMRPGALDLRYADLIAPWADVFGRDRVELIPYDHEVIPRVLSSIDKGLAEESSLHGYRTRVSAKPDVVAALRLANLTVARSTPDGVADAAWVRGTQLRRQVKAWLLQSVQGEPTSAWSLDEDRLERLSEMADLDAARLRDGYGFVLVAADDVPVTEASNDAEAGELLARALIAKAAKPWTWASLTGAALATTVALRETMELIRQKGAHAWRERIARSSLGARH